MGRTIAAGIAADHDEIAARHLLKPMSVRLRQVFGFRSCLSLRQLRGRLVTKIRRACRGSILFGGLRRSFATRPSLTFTTPGLPQSSNLRLRMEPFSTRRQGGGAARANRVRLKEDL